MAITGLIADKNLRPITDPDPVAIVDEFKDLPDNVLIGYAQDRSNPNATYALTVLMSRKRAKEKMQSEQMPTSTVADEVIADVSGTPKTTQGIGGASMFVPQDQKRQYLAQQLQKQAGPQGIVAEQPNMQSMAQGGLTQLKSNVGNYADGGIVAFAGDTGSYVKEKLFGGVGLGNSVRSKGKGFPLQYYDDGSDFVPGANSFKRENLGLIDLSEEDLAKLSEQDRNFYLQAKDLERRQKNKKIIDELQGDKKEMIKAIEEKEKAAKEAAQEEGTISEDIKSNEQSIMDDYKLKADDLADSIGVDFDALKDPRTMSDISKEVRETRRAAGIDQDYLKPVQEDILSQKQLLKKETGRAADLAMLEAGLLIMGGTSPNALSNLKEAAPAVRNYGVQLGKLRAEDRDLAKMELQIKAAEQATKIGEADKAMALYDSVNKLNRDIDKTKLTEKNKIKIAELQARSYANRFKGVDKDLFERLVKDPRYQTKGADGKMTPNYNKITEAIASLRGSQTDVNRIFIQAQKGWEDLPDYQKEQYGNFETYYQEYVKAAGASGSNTAVDFSTLK